MKKILNLVNLFALPVVLTTPCAFYSCSQKQEFEFVGESQYATARNEISAQDSPLFEIKPVSVAIYKKFKYIGEGTFDTEYYKVEVYQKNTVFKNISARMIVPSDYEENEFDIIVESTGYEDVNVPPDAYGISLVIRRADNNSIVFQNDDFIFQVKETISNVYKDTTQLIFPQIEEYETDDQGFYHAKFEYDGFVWFHKPETAEGMPSSTLTFDGTYHPDNWEISGEPEFCESIDGRGTHSICFDINTKSKIEPVKVAMDPIKINYSLNFSSVSPDIGVFEDQHAKIGFPFYTSSLSKEAPTANCSLEIIDKDWESRIGIIRIENVEWNAPENATVSDEDFVCELSRADEGELLPELWSATSFVKYHKDTKKIDVYFEIITKYGIDEGEILDPTVTYMITVAFYTPYLSPLGVSYYTFPIEPYSPV